MAERPRKILICSCEDTMPLDGAAVRRVCRGSEVIEGRQFCRAELERFRKAAAGGEPVTVACTQEAPVFSEAAGETEGAGELTFVNIREAAGWSKDAQAAGPKMAALLAAAAEPPPEISYVSLSSEGVTLLYGSDERVIEAAQLLKDHLDLTVLIKQPGEVSPLRVTEYPLVKGAIRSAKGHLGAFEVTIDDYAQPTPSSRDELKFGPARNDVVTRCDLLIDLSGGRTAISRRRSARRLFARRSWRSGRDLARRAQGARLDRQLREAALRHLQRGPVRACALRHRRLPPLPRSLPDRRDRAERRSRRDRCGSLRRLRTMRRRLPDGCCVLRAAAIGRAVA